MSPMILARWFRGLLWPTVGGLLCATACSRPIQVPGAGEAQAEQRTLPDQSTAVPADAVTSLTGPDSSSQIVPFHDSENLPAGTLLTVRLKSPVTADDALTSTSFEAVLDEPVVVEGNALIPRGVLAAGRIQSSRISTVNPSRAYIRLALESIHVADKDIPVQTASLFARQAPQSDNVIRLEKGRRLSFRLSEPVSIAAQKAPRGH